MKFYKTILFPTNYFSLHYCKTFDVLDSLSSSDRIKGMKTHINFKNSILMVCLTFKCKKGDIDVKSLNSHRFLGVEYV